MLIVRYPFFGFMSVDDLGLDRSIRATGIPFEDCQDLGMTIFGPENVDLGFRRNQRGEPVSGTEGTRLQTDIEARRTFFIIMGMILSMQNIGYALTPNMYRVCSSKVALSISLSNHLSHRSRR
jgi:hypothetical protein